MAGDVLRKIRDGLRHAFDLDGPHGPLTGEDRLLMGRIARAVVARGMSLPAVLFLDSVRPLNSVGSQALVFLRPFLTGLFSPADYDRAVDILDRREGLQALIEEIEAAQTPGKDRTK